MSNGSLGRLARLRNFAQPESSTFTAVPRVAGWSTRRLFNVDEMESLMRGSVESRTVTSKLAAILQVFSTGDVHSLSEIARHAGLPVSTAHRLAHELTAWGLLEKVPARGYRVGAALRAIGGRWRQDPGIYSKGRRIVGDLAAATRMRSRFGVLVGREVRFMETEAGHRPPPQGLADAGLPAHTTAMGKALLAFAPPEVVDAVVRELRESSMPFAGLAEAAFRKELAAVRLSRVATCFQEPPPVGGSVAVPVFAAGGVAVASLEVCTDGTVSQIGAARAALVVAARAMSHQLCAPDGTRAHRHRGAMRAG